MHIVRDKLFMKQMKKVPHPLRVQVRDRVQLLTQDEQHPLLHNHQLTGEYRGYRSINITGDWRLVYQKLDSDTYYLRAVGTHHQLYGT